jgi:hypothetical protein
MKIVSRLLDLSLFTIYGPITFITAPFLIMNPYGLITIVPSLGALTLIGSDCNKSKAAVSITGLTFGAIIYKDDINDYIKNEF